MEIPTVSLLTAKEQSTFIEFVDGDSPANYGPYYHLPFARIVEIARRLPPTNERGVLVAPGFKASNWNSWLKGYSDWAVPDGPVDPDAADDSMEYMMKYMMLSNMRHQYRNGNPKNQLQKLFAAPIQRQLEAFGKTETYSLMADKLFVLKIALHPVHTTQSDDFWDRINNPDVVVWRLVTVWADTGLDSFHDQIIAPAMGWRRHYHGHQFMVPTSGAVFGPEQSDAMDMMHGKMQGDYFLDSEAYDLRHVLRKKGDRLGYLYDLGDSWKHCITVLDVVDKGTTLSVQELGDPQIIEHGVREDNMTIIGNRLWAGAVNCPPEDSSGIEMGRYDEILSEGPSFQPSERGLNWEENGIRCAFDFDLVAHQKRFDAAVTTRKNPVDGNLLFCTSPLSPEQAFSPADAWAARGFLGDRKGRKVKQGHTGNSAAAIEIVGKTKTKNRCAYCGRQPGSNASLERLFDCSRCKQVAYCDTSCQGNDWKKHKTECKRNARSLA